MTISIPAKIAITLVSLLLVALWGEWRYSLDILNQNRLERCWLAGMVVMWVWM